MKTRITERFGVQHPMIQGGAHFLGLAELAGVYPSVEPRRNMDAGAWPFGWSRGRSTAFRPARR